MNVIILEPSFPDNQKQFARALAEAGATVIGIGERAKDWLDDDVKGWLTHYEQVGSVTDEGQLYDAVQTVQRMVWVDRMEATVEAHIMAAAKVRAACGIPGTSERTAFLCRDKPAMKEVLRAAGVSMRRFHRRPLGRRCPPVRRRGRLPAHRQAGSRRRSVGHDAGELARRAGGGHRSKRG